jgi:hypothetical protein
LIGTPQAFEWHTEAVAGPGPPYGLVAAELDALLQAPTPRPGPPLLSGQWRDTAVEEVATA